MSLHRAPLRWLAVLSLLLFAAIAAAQEPTYAVDYEVSFVPADGEAQVRITTTPGTSRLMRLRFTPDPDRHRAFQADGRLDVGERLTWRPPEAGGTLTFRYKIDRKRKRGAFDARITSEWAMFRADRMIPPASVIAKDRGRAQATLRFALPDGWTNADVGYVFDERAKAFTIDNRARRFQQPVGWIIAGQVGTRREFLEGMEVSVGGPKGSDLRRNDVLAVVNTVASHLNKAFGRLPKKILIVGAGNPMWRGGLSAPNSLFLHADRPLISENASSTIVHELVHVVSRIRGTRRDDWITEGLAEFYSIEMLRRAGLISESRATKAFTWMKRHGSRVERLHGASSKGPRTARAVTLFAALNREIVRATDGRRSLDDVMQQLVDRGRISTEQLREAAQNVLGKPSTALNARVLDTSRPSATEGDKP